MPKNIVAGGEGGGPAFGLFVYVHISMFSMEDSHTD